jgi:hypothetical protein
MKLEIGADMADLHQHLAGARNQFVNLLYNTRFRW